MVYSPSIQPDLFYPEDDGKPMAENTKQYRWIVIIKENLEILLATNLDAFIAGDLLWFPVMGDNVTCTAPDVMVVMGRPKGDRRSYKQWEERNIPPTVVFEIMSPSNTQKEMLEKRDFYELHGVDEFYVYDPDRHRITGYIRKGRKLLSILKMEGWTSPALNIQFSNRNGELEIYYPDGNRFLTTLELKEQAVIAQEQAVVAQEQVVAAQEQAVAAQEQAVAAQEQAVAAQEQAVAAQERAIEFEQRATAAEQERDRLLAQLRALGINPE